jgi:Zn-dependent protease
MKFVIFVENFLAVLFWTLMIFGFEIRYIAVLTILAAILHEGGHIMAFLLFTKKIPRLPIGNIFGFRISHSQISLKQEAWVAASGPLTNIILGLAFLPFSYNSYLQTFAMLNFMTAFSNLLPIEGYDGYKIISAWLLNNSKDSMRAEKILSAISFVFSADLCFLALYLMLKVGGGYWIYAVLIYTLTANMAKQIKNEN